MDVVIVIFIIGGVFLLGPSVESLNTTFGNIAGFLFIFSLAPVFVLCLIIFCLVVVCANWGQTDFLPV